MTINAYFIHFAQIKQITKTMAKKKEYALVSLIDTGMETFVVSLLCFIYVRFSSINASVQDFSKSDGF